MREYLSLLKYKLSMHWEVIETSMNEQKHLENKGKIMGTMEGGYLINGKKKKKNEWARSHQFTLIKTTLKFK